MLVEKIKINSTTAGFSINFLTITEAKYLMQVLEVQRTIIACELLVMKVKFILEAPVPVNSALYQQYMIQRAEYHFLSIIIDQYLKAKSETF
jgi:hypothetical protein